LITHIGFDDTDSPKGGCTTYLAAIIAQDLIKMGADFVDYPNLVRLNPNTPWKTRGNASVCLRFNLDNESMPDAKETVIKLIERYSEFWCENTNPGVVFCSGKVPNEIKDFSRKVVQQIVQIKEAENLIQKHHLHAIGWKNRRGIIGGLSAIGGTLEGDHTYELITYRNPVYWGTSRKLDEESIRKMDKTLKSSTFNNITERGDPMIAPHGPDPVLYGVRGETPESVYKAYLMIKELEPVERWMVYRTNQGTDAHFKEPINIKDLKPYNPAIIQGTVTDSIKTIQGGHVIFEVKDKSGRTDCAVYEPTGNLRHIVWDFIKGDKVRVFGGVRPLKKGLTLNVEKIEVISLVENIHYVNPSCPKCGGSTESMGKEKGYRCKKCGYKNDKLTKKPLIHPREINTGIYLPDRDAQRHLTKPLKRYGKENHYDYKEMFEPWINENN
jgi:tRNA(Ile2)-agmatinylcytidine synthase